MSRNMIIGIVVVVVVILGIIIFSGGDDEVEVEVPETTEPAN